MVQQVKTRTEVRFYIDKYGNPKMDFLNKALGDLEQTVNGLFLNINWNNVSGKIDPASNAPWTFDLTRIEDADEIILGGTF